MNDKKYLEKMTELTEELERAGNAKPYDPDAYNDVIDRLNLVFDSKGQRRRRLPLFALFFCLAMLCVLLLIVYWILSILWVRSTL